MSISPPIACHFHIPITARSQLQPYSLPNTTSTRVQGGQKVSQLPTIMKFY